MDPLNRSSINVGFLSLMFVLIGFVVVTMPAKTNLSFDVNRPDAVCGIPYYNYSSQYPILQVTPAGQYMLDGVQMDDGELFRILVGMSAIKRLSLTILPDPYAPTGAFLKALGVARESGVAHGVARFHNGEPMVQIRRAPAYKSRVSPRADC